MRGSEEEAVGNERRPPEDGSEERRPKDGSEERPPEDGSHDHRRRWSEGLFAEIGHSSRRSSQIDHGCCIFAGRLKIFNSEWRKKRLIKMT
jgi:hypothetical protein